MRDRAGGSGAITARRFACTSTGSDNRPFGSRRAPCFRRHPGGPLPHRHRHRRHLHRFLGARHRHRPADRAQGSDRAFPAGRWHLRRSRRAGRRARRRSRPGRLPGARHDDRRQRADRTHRCPARHAGHRGLPGPADHPAPAPASGAVLVRQPSDAAGAARTRPRGRRTTARRRHGGHAPRRSEPGRRGARRACTRCRGPGGVPAARLPQSGPRARGPRLDRARGTRPVRLLLARGLAADARIRARDRHDRERLRDAAGRPLPR